MAVFYLEKFMPKSKKRNKPYNQEKSRIRLKNGLQYFLFNQAHIFVDDIQEEMQQNALNNRNLWLHKHEKVMNGSTDMRHFADILVVLQFYKKIIESKEYHYCIYAGINNIDDKKLCAYMAVNELEQHNLLLDTLMQRFLNIEGLYVDEELTKIIAYKGDDAQKIRYKINDLANWIEHLEYRHFEKLCDETEAYLIYLKKTYHQIYEQKNQEIKRVTL
jgi:hypothetical protein